MYLCWIYNGWHGSGCGEVKVFWFAPNWAPAVVCTLHLAILALPDVIRSRGICSLGTGGEELSYPAISRKRESGQVFGQSFILVENTSRRFPALIRRLICVIYSRGKPMKEASRVEGLVEQSKNLRFWGTMSFGHQLKWRAHTYAMRTSCTRRISHSYSLSSGSKAQGMHPYRDIEIVQRSMKGDLLKPTR